VYMLPYPPEQVPCNTVCCWLSGAVQVVGLVVEEPKATPTLRDTRFVTSLASSQHPPHLSFSSTQRRGHAQNMSPCGASKINHAKLCDLRQQSRRRESYQRGTVDGEMGHNTWHFAALIVATTLSASCHAKSCSSACAVSRLGGY